MATAKKSASAKAAKPAAKKAASVQGKAKAAPAEKKSAASAAAAKPATPVKKSPAKAKQDVASVKSAKPVTKELTTKNELKEVKKSTAKAADVIAPAKKAEKKDSIKPVKLPKITAQGKVPYEPDFTHSVLDGPKENAPVTTPTQRYSDSDLAEFRELISRKLESARKELAYLQGLITRKDDAGGEGEDGRYMTMEDGTLSMEREQLSQMASRQIQFIDHLEKAMIRIENKTYGICRETGKLIDKARLRAVPHATLSVEAKLRKSR
jgi:RNA polymerase-binding transcription factor DksA